MNIEKAKLIVTNYFPDADDPALEEMLNVSSGIKKDSGESYYRPQYVAAHFILTHYRQLTRADEVSFNYSDQTKIAQSLLDIQKAIDGDNEVSEGFRGDELLATIDEYPIGVSVY